MITSKFFQTTRMVAVFFLLLILCQCTLTSSKGGIKPNKNSFASSHQISREEPYPANSLPLDLLKNDKETFFKEIPLPEPTLVQTFEGKQYGIREFASREIRSDLVGFA